MLCCVYTCLLIVFSDAITLARTQTASGHFHRFDWYARDNKMLAFSHHSPLQYAKPLWLETSPQFNLAWNIRSQLLPSFLAGPREIYCHASVLSFLPP